MTIKELAQIAGVSVSTVSKIMNSKDQNIGTETRARVLQLIKEYNYFPYADIRQLNKTQSFRIGVLLTHNGSEGALLRGIIDSAEDNKYSVLVYTSKDAEQELKNINRLCTQNVDGVLYFSVDQDSERQKNFTNKKIPCILFRRSFCIDYKHLGQCLTELLANRMHHRIGCAVPASSDGGEDFIEGYKQCLYEHNIHFDEHLCYHSDLKNEQSDKADLLFQQVTGVACYDQRIAGQIYEQAARKKLRIPRDLSVAALMDGEHDIFTIPPLSGIRLPWTSLGRFACERLIAQIEKVRVPETRFDTPILSVAGGSIDVPSNLHHQRIVVVGAINMDTMIYVDTLPKMGETMAVKSCANYPGGKGVNEAIGAAKLGAEVYLIGRLGQDYEGHAISDALNVNNVNTDGIKTDPKCATGRAYIFVRSDGSSSIAILGGANSRIRPSDIEENAYMFEGANFCLLPTELNMETMECASKIAKENGVKILVKPSVVTQLSDTLLKRIDILLPNRNEIAILCPHEKTLEEKAQYFLNRGVGAVIVTLDEDGCYLRTEKQSIYFKAADFKPVDTSGAADAFAATLAVYLSKKYDLTVAIGYANIAAGISITRQGVSSALADRSTLELYIGK